MATGTVNVMAGPFGNMTAMIVEKGKLVSDVLATLASKGMDVENREVRVGGVPLVDDADPIVKDQMVISVHDEIEGN